MFSWEFEKTSRTSIFQNDSGRLLTDPLLTESYNSLAILIALPKRIPRATA